MLWWLKLHHIIVTILKIILLEELIGGRINRIENIVFSRIKNK